LGSGRGTDAIRLAETVGEKGFVYGIDISEGMINKAIKTAERMDIKNIRFINTSLEETRINSNSVDLVVSNCTINHAGDKQKVWNEIYRILKKGGRFVVSDIYALIPVPDEFRNNAEAVAECWAGSVTRNEYLFQLKNAGFEKIQILEESSPYLKGKIEVSGWTISGTKPSDGKCCCNN
jgi:ubiquinone/menaquinone biosynthesis C-methylase UbiE